MSRSTTSLGSDRGNFVRKLLDMQLVDPLRLILLFLVAAPFILMFIVIGAVAGYVMAGDLGGGIGSMAGLLVGFGVALRYYERVQAKIRTAQLVPLALLAVVISLSFDHIPGGLVVAAVGFSAIGIGLIIWSGKPRPDSARAITAVPPRQPQPPRDEARARRER